jgi:membrane associated rhomboid family serine protease
MIPLRDLNPTRTRAYLTVAFIVLNALVFLWQIGHRGLSGELLYYRYGVIPKCFLAQGNAEKHDAAVEEALERLAEMRLLNELRARGVRYLTPQAEQAVAHQAERLAEEWHEQLGSRCEWFTLLASMFMHGGWLHIIGNMWFLWIFGNNIEDACGRIRFIIFYLLCGLLATAGHIIAGPSSVVPSIGASGAISGVLGAYLILCPTARVLSLIPLGYFYWAEEVPAWVFLGVWILLQWISGLGALHDPATGGVAWFAHIAGFFAGVGLIFLFRQRRAAPPSGIEFAVDG